MKTDERDLDGAMRELYTKQDAIQLTPRQAKALLVELHRRHERIVELEQRQATTRADKWRQAYR